MASFHGVAAKLPVVGEKDMDCKGAEEQDIFKEVPVRYLGYANEVGEAFRNMLSLRFVHLSYAISTGYVLSHAVSRGFRAVQSNNNPSSNHHHHHSCATSTHNIQCRSNSVVRTSVSPSTAVIDTLIWQGLASVLIPGLAINRLCAVSRFALNRHTGRLLSEQVRKWAVTGVGMGSIPLIIHPIDSAVDSFMSTCMRPVLRHLFT